MALTNYSEEIMSFSISSTEANMIRAMNEADRLQRQMSAMEEIKRFQRQMSGIEEIERIREIATQIKETEQIRKIVEMTDVCTVWKSCRGAQYQAIERFQQEMEIVDRIRRQMVTVSHARPTVRNKAGATGSGRKSSAKKSTKSSGGDGGSDSDGDGPQHVSTERKRPKKNRKPSPAHSPSIHPGVIVPQQFPSLTPHSPPPSSPQSSRIELLDFLALLLFWSLAFTADELITKILAIIVTAIFALCLKGHSDVAKTLLTSKIVSSLIARFSGKDDAE
jgi:hypothetical protein